MKRLIIAIDGPAASGKSSTAKKVARALNYLYIDTGAMYRALTFLVLKGQINPQDTDAVAKLSESCDIQLVDKNGITTVFANGQDVTNEIRTPEVTRNIQPVAANAAVRERMVALQRESGRDGGVVLDGRDIGTVVFPKADLKIFMIASPQERARRRLAELATKNIQADLKELMDEIIARDASDEQRAVGPLKKADDAIVIDTTELTFDEQLEKILELARQQINA